MSVTKLAISLSALAALFTVGGLQEKGQKPTGNEPAVLVKQLEPFRPLLGKTYTGEFSSSTPDKPAIDVQNWERILNGNGIRSLHSLNQGSYGGETIYMWDKARKLISYHYFTTGGFMTTGTMKFHGNTWETHEVVKGSESTVTEVKSVGTLKPNGDLEITTSMLKGTTWQQGASVTYKETPDAKVIFR